MSSSAPALHPGESPDGTPPARTSSPFRNPTYPARTHWSERPALEEKLRTWDLKIDALAQKLAVLGKTPSRSSYERIYHQLLGARDQLADAVRRMPREAGSLYDEDRERLLNAEAALDRLVRQWEELRF